MDEVVTKKDAEKALRTLLRYIGEDPDRSELKETPARMIKMFDEIFRGYKKEAAPQLTMFKNKSYTEQLITDSGEFYSLCEHHMLPFFGNYFFAYIPSGQIIGLSKISRIVTYCAARLQVQENLSEMILNEIEKAFESKPRGMGLILKSKHLCKIMRGARVNGEMQTMQLTGLLKENESLKNQFMTFAHNY